MTVEVAFSPFGPCLLGPKPGRWKQGRHAALDEGGRRVSGVATDPDRDSHLVVSALDSLAMPERLGAADGWGR